jgi:hypothetical protein
MGFSDDQDMATRFAYMESQPMASLGVGKMKKEK